MAEKTIWVQALTRDRKVILSEYDESHPTPNHEIWIVGYEDPRVDADGNAIEPANPPIEVGDTPGVRLAISQQLLAIADAPMARQQAARPSVQTVASPTSVLGADVADRLAAAGYDTEDSIREASDDELRAIPGIGDATVKRIRAFYPEQE